MKINTISDLKELVTSLGYEDNTPLAISINGQAECFAVAPLPFSKAFGQKQPDLVSLQIFRKGLFSENGERHEYLII
ncbi:hypothetical protein KF7HA_02420 [Lactococcus lactis]|nr:hypothetical protein [Lactococcus lactis]